MGRRLMAVALAATMAAPSIAVATLGPDAPASAESRYQIGRRLYREGKFAEAAAEFKAALAVYPSAKLAYNQARSAERAGDLAQAIEAFEVYLKLAPAADDRAEVQALLPVLRERLQATYPEVALTTQPPGAAIFVDGATTPLERKTPTTVRLKPGAHTLRFALDGHHTIDRSVQVASGAGATVDVRLEKKDAPAPAVAAVTPPPAPPPAPDGLTTLDWTGIGLSAAGAAAVAVGVVFHLQMLDDADTAEGLSDAEYAMQEDTLRDDFESHQTLTVVGYALGGALIATGVTLVLWPEAPATTATLLPTPDGAVMSWRF